jgi:hypothetical protein
MRFVWHLFGDLELSSRPDELLLFLGSKEGAIAVLAFDKLGFLVLLVTI